MIHMTDAFGQNPALKIQKVACRLITYVYANGTQCTHYIQTYLAGLADYNFSYYHMFLLRQFDPSRDNDIKTKVRMTHFEFVTFLVCFLSMLCNFLHKLNFVNIFP